MLIANENHLLLLAKQLTKLELDAPIPIPGTIERDIDRYGVYKELNSNLTFTKAEEPLFGFYVALTLIVLSIFRSRLNNSEFFNEVFSSVTKQEEGLYSNQHTAFPYEDKDFPYSSDLNELLKNSSILNELLENISSVITAPLIKIWLKRMV